MCPIDRLESFRDEFYKMRFAVFTDTNDLAGIPLFYRPATNRIRVVARSIDIGKWEDIIRKLDVPEKEAEESALNP